MNRLIKILLFKIEKCQILPCGICCRHLRRVTSSFEKGIIDKFDYILVYYEYKCIYILIYEFKYIYIVFLLHPSLHQQLLDGNEYKLSNKRPGKIKVSFLFLNELFLSIISIMNALQLYSCTFLMEKSDQTEQNSEKITDLLLNLAKKSYRYKKLKSNSKFIFQKHFL